ncbi:MAG: peroxisomal targeting signal 2 receptor [Chaenotheca gracillima]|nr:MAG: peroxisomal targeting signal 2 receptor [Chaenotheca gracillima]
MSSHFQKTHIKAVDTILTELKDPTEEIHKCGRPCIQLLTLRSPDRLRDLIRFAREKLHAYPFQYVPTCWRRLYTDASILLAGEGSTLEGCRGQDRSDQGSLKAGEDDPVGILDLAIILTGAPKRQDLIEELLEGIEKDLAELREEKEEDDGHDMAPAPKRRKVGPEESLPSLSFPAQGSTDPDIRHPARHVEGPSALSMTAFQRLKVPLIIKNAVVEWPAFERWRDPSYLLRRTLNGRRLVPVELGRAYTDEGWGQAIVPFSQFLDEYILQGSHEYSKDRVAARSRGKEGEEEVVEPGKIGYLAQHDLFQQIPALKNDVLIPDYCYVHAEGGHGDDDDSKPSSPYLNAWFGSAGTVSPLHTDPYRNVFCQVVGRKYVRLYAPEETNKLYPRGVEEGGVDMQNTSMVDVEEIESRGAKGKDAEDKFPDFKGASYVEGILEEGDSLFIPTGWWHYVRSLTVSFSVSFWFR